MLRVCADVVGMHRDIREMRSRLGQRGCYKSRCRDEYVSLCRVALGAQRRLHHAFFDISDRWDLGASRCATERSDFKKSGWNAGGRDHYNVPAPAVAARRRPLGAASRRPHQTLSEAAAAKFRKRQRAAHADSAPLGGRGNMYQTHTRCAMGAGIDLRTACLHLGCHACSAARCS